MMTSRGITTTKARRLANDDDYRREAKQAYAEHNAATGGLDVLERCKRLNEFLSSDFLKEGSNQKDQLKDILDILKAPASNSKRPSFLDQPSVTAQAVAAAAAAKAQAAAKQANRSAGGTVLDGAAADKLLQMLDEEDEQAGARPSVPPSPATPSASARAQPPPLTLDTDDLIGLLNGSSGSSRPSSSALLSRSQKPTPVKDPGKQQREDAFAEDLCKRNADAAARLAEAAAAEEERQRRLRAEADAAAAAEAERLRREREAAAAAAAAAEKLRVQRELEERERAKRRGPAASTIQRAWRAHLRRKRAREARAAALRARADAATVLQSAIRAVLACRLVRRMCQEAFVRHRSARLIQRAWRAYRQYGSLAGRVLGKDGLGKLRVSTYVRATPVGASHLLAIPLRLRSTSDVRLAPNSALVTEPSVAATTDDLAQGRRAVVLTKQRVQDVSSDERRRRGELHEVATRLGSAHHRNSSTRQVVGEYLASAGSGSSLGGTGGSTRAGTGVAGAGISSRACTGVAAALNGGSGNANGGGTPLPHSPASSAGGSRLGSPAAAPGGGARLGSPSMALSSGNSRLGSPAIPPGGATSAIGTPKGPPKGPLPAAATSAGLFGPRGTSPGTGPSVSRSSQPLVGSQRADSPRGALSSTPLPNGKPPSPDTGPMRASAKPPSPDTGALRASGTGGGLTPTSSMRSASPSAAVGGATSVLVRRSASGFTATAAQTGGSGGLQRTANSR